jgi:hypothetical protein
MSSSTPASAQCRATPSKSSMSATCTFSNSIVSPGLIDAGYEGSDIRSPPILAVCEHRMTYDPPQSLPSGGTIATLVLLRHRSASQRLRHIVIVSLSVVSPVVVDLLAILVTASPDSLSSLTRSSPAVVSLVVPLTSVQHPPSLKILVRRYIFYVRHWGCNVSTMQSSARFL